MTFAYRHTVIKALPPVIVSERNKRANLDVSTGVFLISIIVTYRNITLASMKFPTTPCACAFSLCLHEICNAICCWVDSYNHLSQTQTPYIYQAQNLWFPHSVHATNFLPVSLSVGVQGITDRLMTPFSRKSAHLYCLRAVTFQLVCPFLWAQVVSPVAWSWFLYVFCCQTLGTHAQWGLEDFVSVCVSASQHTNLGYTQHGGQIVVYTDDFCYKGDFHETESWGVKKFFNRGNCLAMPIPFY